MRGLSDVCEMARRKSECAVGMEQRVSKGLQILVCCVSQGTSNPACGGPRVQRRRLARRKKKKKKEVLNSLYLTFLG